VSLTSQTAHARKIQHADSVFAGWFRQILLSFGKLFEKGLSLGTGQCNVKAYNRYLRDLIISGRAKPSFVVSNEVSLDDAPDAYDKFDRRVEGYTKVLLHPNGPLS